MAEPDGPILLYWTKYFGVEEWEGRRIDYCGLPYTCTFTHDRSKLDKAALLVFHTRDVDFHDLPSKPVNRSHPQPWILNTAESPINDLWQLDSKKMARFQYSMTYRFDSSFPVTYFYPTLLSSVLAAPPVSASQKRGRAPIAWVVSNCHAKNGRHHYVRELMRYIDVDVYGRGGCVPVNQEWPGDDIQLRDLAASYKFYLALENSNCHDYVTEKLEAALQAGTVPIVDGPNDYAPFAPTPNALIRIDAFASPRDLATYLRELDTDDELYFRRHLAYRAPAGDERRQELSAEFLRHWNYSNQGPGEWGYDQLGGRCKLCKFARDVQTGVVTAEEVEARALMPDQSCVSGKHFKWRRVLGVPTGQFEGFVPRMVMMLVFLATMLVARGRVRRIVVRWVSGLFVRNQQSGVIEV